MSTIVLLRCNITTTGKTGISSDGYICLTEAPITMLPTMFDIFRKYDEPMFAPYGIGIKKNVFYNTENFMQDSCLVFTNELSL